MMHFLFCLIIKPLILILEFLFNNIYQVNNNISLTILLISFIVSMLCLPLYLRADELSEEEADIQKKLSKRVQSIKKNYKGDERLFLLQTYYKQNNYHPIMGLRLSLSLLLQIPIFIAAYTFFHHLTILQGMSCGLIHDLSMPDGILNLGNFRINIFPILMTAVNIQAGYIYSKNKSFKENKLLIIVSLVFLILLYNSPAALVLYWMFNNIFSLIKNILLKIFTHENIIKYASAFALVLYYINTRIYHLDLDLVVFALAAILIFKSDFFKNNNFNFDYKKLYIYSMIALWVLIGLYIPSKVVMASPLEFLFKDATPMNILNNTSVIFAGLFLFWGTWVYYFANIKIKKILSAFACLALFLALTNFIMIKMPSAILLNSFVFEIGRINFNTNTKIYGLLYFIITLSVIILIIKSIIANKTKVINGIIISIIMTCTTISIYNAYKINHKTEVYLARHANINASVDKYIKLSKTHKNVLIIFVDRAINSYLPIIFNEHPQLFNQFQGFTYYPNTLSYSGYTLIGYLPILGGYEYTPFNMDNRNALFEDKFYESLAVLPSIFKKNNWNATVINPPGDGWENETWGGVTQDEIDTLANNKLYKRFGIEHLNIPNTISKNLGTDIKTVDSNLSKRNIIYFSILSALSPSARNYLYDNGLYHNPLQNIRINYSPLFLKNYSELYYLPELTDFSADKNSFVVFNNYMTHYPSLLSYPNYDISYSNKMDYICPLQINDNNFSLSHYHVNVAMLKFLGKYFDYLRKNNVYDNTRIIIVADHGFGYNLQHPGLGQFEADNYLPYNPLLLVKDFNNNTMINTSLEFMTNADVPLLATNGIIKNPTNPFTNKLIVPDKKNGVLIKHDVKWQPAYYLGKNKVIVKDDIFNYVNNDPLDHRNWKVNLTYNEALKIYNNYK